MQTVAARIVLLTLNILLVTGCSTVPASPGKHVPGKFDSTRLSISRLIKKEMKKHNVTGLSIALVDDQQLVWAQGFGYADRKNKIPATPETTFRVGSIAKLLTATAAMQLADQRKLDIDQPIETYLPQFTIKRRFTGAAPITLRSIMTHHSGLPSDLHKGMLSRSPAPLASVISLIKAEYAAYPPDFVLSYSNLAVTLLGHVIETVNGQDFNSHMTASLLSPMGMTRSYFSAQPQPGLLSAKGYRKHRESDILPLRDVPAGGLNSNVLDLGRFMQMVFAGGRAGGEQILKPETLAEMLRPQNTDVPLDLNFHVGLGWVLKGFGDIDIKNAGPVAYHGGATLLFHSQLIVLPEHKLGVVVLANSFSARNAVDKIAIKAINMALEAKTGIKQPERKTVPLVKKSLSSATLETFAGQYATLFGTIKITRKGDSLRLHALNKKLHLVPRADGQLAMRYKFLGFIPISLDALDHLGLARSSVAGRELLVVSSGDRELLVGEKIQPVPIPDKWLERLGDYEISNPGDDAILLRKLRLRREDGFLRIEYTIPFFSKRAFHFAVAPLSDTEAVLYGIGRGMGETIQTVTVDGKEQLLYSGFLYRKKNKMTDA